MAVNLVVSQAERLVSQRRYAEAVDVLERHLAKARDDHMARNLLAFAHYQSGNYDAAEAVYRIMVAVPRPDARDLYSLGRTLEQQGKLAEATHWIGAAAAADPRFTRAVDDRDRLAKANPDPARAVSPQSPPIRTPSKAPMPLSELNIPLTEDELDKYADLSRARARVDWWTQHWYGLPLLVRGGRMIAWGVTLIGFAFVIGLFVSGYTSF